MAGYRYRRVCPCGVKYWAFRGGGTNFWCAACRDEAEALCLLRKIEVLRDRRNVRLHRARVYRARAKSEGNFVDKEDT